MEQRKKQVDPMINSYIFNNYFITKKLGEGSFGRIYQAEYRSEQYALKFESKAKSQSLLEAEANFMSYLQGRNNSNIFIYISWYTIRQILLNDWRLQRARYAVTWKIT